MADMYDNEEAPAPAPEESESESEASGAALLPKTILHGRAPKVGETITVRIDRVLEDEILVSPADEEGTEEGEEQAEASEESSEGEAPAEAPMEEEAGMY